MVATVRVGIAVILTDLSRTRTNALARARTEPWDVRAFSVSTCTHHALARARTEPWDVRAFSVSTRTHHALARARSEPWDVRAFSVSTYVLARRRSGRSRPGQAGFTIHVGPNHPLSHPRRSHCAQRPMPCRHLSLVART